MSAASTSRRILHFLILFYRLCLAISTSDELQTLLNIKTSIQSPNADVFNSWKPTNPLCNFTGIAYNPDGSINSIDLSNQKLTDSVPFDSICQLSSLETLALGKNSFSGPISEDLNSSVFSGNFPWNSISNMTGLVVLSVGDNPFDRTRFPNMMVSHKKLNWLYLANCSIEGKIPSEIGNLTELVNLELSDNYMSGEIPLEISKLLKLFHLHLVKIALDPISRPFWRISAGRPKKQRRRGLDEPQDPNKVSRKNRKMACSKCLKKGHNL